MARPVSRGAKTSPELNLTGFHFSYRDGFFDWRTLHGIDVEAVVREGMVSIA